MNSKSDWLDDELRPVEPGERLWMGIQAMANQAVDAGLTPYSVRLNKGTLDLLGKFVRKAKLSSGTSFWVVEVESGMLRVDYDDRIPVGSFTVTVVPTKSLYTQIYYGDDGELNAEQE